MTKRKFYIIKTLVAIGLSVSIYFYIDLLKKFDELNISSDLKFGILVFSVVVVFPIFIIVMEFLLNYQRPKFPEEIKEEKREEQELLKKYDERINEFNKKRRQNLKETLPLLEITMSNNEKIKGKFLEKSEYFEDVETENRYYKTSIVKIEKESMRSIN
jgi:hypothetical protein